jgi:DNA invertase Pin-like site-specific DNA recombinase
LRQGSAHKVTPEVREQVRRMAADGTKKAAIARVSKVSRQTVRRPPASARDEFGEAACRMVRREILFG